MNDFTFHHVDPDDLKQITIEDIQSGHSFPSQKLDYSVPIPTSDQSIPRSSQDVWLTIELGFDQTMIKN